MINLRFHIVSIVAIFLALAIGMLAGSTLLDRATVGVLQGRQKSLDSRNSRLRAENDDLRSASDARAKAETAFGGQPLAELLPGLLSDEPVLVIATRGIDEDSVRALQTALREGGASPLGIVWADDRLNLDDTDTAAGVATALGLDVAPRRSKAAVIAELDDALSTASGEVAVPETAVEGASPAAEPPAELAVLSTLVDANLLDWESPNEGEPGSRSLPNGGLRLVVLSGEGAELEPSALVYPLIRSLSSRRAGVIVGEVRVPRTDLEEMDDPSPSKRGDFIDPLRNDDDLAGSLITVDNIDEPFGRVAAVLAMSDLSTITTGSYGIAPSAAQPFPTTG